MTVKKRRMTSRTQSFNQRRRLMENKRKLQEVLIKDRAIAIVGLSQSKLPLKIKEPSEDKETEALFSTSPIVLLCAVGLQATMPRLI